MDLLELGKKAITAGWAWSDGSTFLGAEGQARSFTHEGRQGWLTSHPGVSFPERDEMVPDFSDPATRGCLLAQVRKAWDDPSLHVWVEDESRPLEWKWEDDGLVAPMLDVPNVYYGSYDSEAKAMVSALVAANDRKGSTQGGTDE